MDGIRSLSICWVICGHILSQPYTSFGNLNEVFSLMKTGSFVALTGGTISVDTFFTIGGLLTSYLATKTWNSAKRSGMAAVCKTYILYILNRYARLTPMLAVLVWSAQSFWPTIGSGAKFTIGTQFQNEGLPKLLMRFSNSYFMQKFISRAHFIG